MQRALFRVLPFAILLAVAGWVWLARRAASDLITLNVRDMDLAGVVRELEDQSWEAILVRPAAAGKISLDVRDMPLTEVLERVAGQLNGSWSRVYALNSGSESYRVFRNALVEGSDNVPGWSRLGAQLSRSTPVIPAVSGASGKALVTLRLDAEPVEGAAKALSRVSRVLVLLEDGTSGPVSMDVRDVPAGGVVEDVARQVHRRCSLCYLLEPPSPSPKAEGAR